MAFKLKKGNKKSYWHPTVAKDIIIKEYNIKEDK